MALAYHHGCKAIISIDPVHDIFIMDWKLIIISFLDTRLMYIELSDRQHPRDLWKIHTHAHTNTYRTYIGVRGVYWVVRPQTPKGFTCRCVWRRASSANERLGQTLLISSHRITVAKEHQKFSHVQQYALRQLLLKCISSHTYQQGGRTWQAFGGGKNGHETFRQERIYNFRDKCVVFARNLKFSNLTQ